MSTETVDHTGSPDADPIDSAERASISDHAARGVEIAMERQAKRDAGETVPDLDVASLPRDRDGRLTIKASAKAPAPPDAALGDRGTSAADASTAAPAAAPAPQLPAQWSEAKKADFGRLTPDAQKLVLQHTAEQDAEHARRTEELSGVADRAQPFLSAYAQHREFLDAQSGRIGVPANEIMGNLVACLRQGTTGQPQERANAAAYVLHLFGVDPRSLQSFGQGQQQGRSADPVAQEIASLRQQQAELGRFQQTIAEERHQQQLATGQRSIDDFASARGEDGQLRYPHFQAVRGLMAPHVERGASFEDAYRIAAKPIEDAVAVSVAARPPQTPAVGTIPTSSSAGRSGRSVPARPSAPRPAGAPRDIAADTTEAMRRAGYVI